MLIHVVLLKTLLNAEVMIFEERRQTGSRRVEEDG